MTSPVKARSFLYSPLVLYILLAAFVFTLGFFIHYGREARASKSWGYVMQNTDVLFYWRIAKGRIMNPRCDGNTFYYEEQGTRSIIPYTAAELVGLASKYTHIPLSWFFPAWHILIPFLTWLILAGCCWKLWNYPWGISAPVTLTLLLSTLFFPYPQTLLSFSRPIDGIAPVFLWISLIFKGDPANRKHCLAMILTSALTLWLQPFYAVFGLWITVMEYAYSLVRGKRLFTACLHLYAMGSCFVSGLVYAGYVFLGKNITWNLLSWPVASVDFYYTVMTMLFFVLVLSFVLFIHFCLKKEVSSLDRLIVEWALFTVLAYVFSTQMRQTREIPLHILLYFFIVMLFSITGWIHEKLGMLREMHLFPKFGAVLAALLASYFAYYMMIRNRLLFEVNFHYFTRVLQYLPFLILILWLLARFERLGKTVMRKEVLCGIILLMTVAGYWMFPVYEPNRNFPFDGGFRWLKEHALKNEVVLTASTKYKYCDYVLLKTDLKSYYHISGRVPSSEYRINFVTGLFLGLLDRMPGYSGWTLEQKLRAYRLDYILMPKPSPFFDEITSQLKGHLLEVYQDPQCLIWRVM